MKKFTVDKIYNSDMKQIHPDPELNKDLMYQYVETPHEHWILGSSNPHQGSTNPREWHIPVAILDNRFTIEEAREARRELAFFISQNLSSFLLGIKGRIALSFEDLEPETGETIRDPQVLGIWDEEKKEIIPVPGRDLTSELRAELKKLEAEGNTKFYLREDKSIKEGNNPSEESKF